MYVKFVNGTTKECTSPTEQKIFKPVNGETIDVGWVLITKIVGNVTSAEIDELFIPENICKLDFLSVNENGENRDLFTLKGYNKITSSIIHYSDSVSSSYAEIQLSKGV